LLANISLPPLPFRSFFLVVVVVVVAAAAAIVVAVLELAPEACAGDASPAPQSGSVTSFAPTVFVSGFWFWFFSFASNLFHFFYRFFFIPISVFTVSILIEMNFFRVPLAARGAASASPSVTGGLRSSAVSWFKKEQAK
jgi:hypothetical protein